MKKIIINCIVLTLVSLFIGCKSVPKDVYLNSDYINKYYAASGEDCNFIFEFINQSNKSLKIVSYVAKTENMINQYNPDFVSSIISVEPGESFDFKFNSNKLLKDYN